MKIVYISSTHFADCDFPLLRQLKLKGHEVYYFMDLPYYATKTNIINISSQIQEEGIFNAYQYEDLKLFKEYLGIENFYVINRLYHKSMLTQSFITFGKLTKILRQISPDVINCVGDLDPGKALALNDYRKRLVMTIHDPFPHTGEKSMRSRINRWLSVKLSKKLILLNQTSVNDFANFWKIDKNKISVSKLGPYECTKLFLPRENVSKKKNLLFYGRISPYKGIEYLCDAMVKVHEKFKDVTLTIAGGGNLYFDYSKYENLKYITLINRYINMHELASLLRECSVVVCPYTDATQSGVILTTYAMERPIIATNVGALQEYVEEGRTGLLIPPKDSESLAQAIISLFSDQSKLKDIENNIIIRNKSNENGWNGIVENYLDAYRSVYKEQSN